MISGALTLRPHPVCVKTHTRNGAGDKPGAEQVRRSVSGLTLIRGGKVPAETLLRHRARRYARLAKIVDGFRPTYRRRDMLGAFLRMALLRASAAEITLTDKHVSSIAITTDEETQKTRLVVRSKRGRKAGNGTAN